MRPFGMSLVASCLWYIIGGNGTMRAVFLAAHDIAKSRHFFADGILLVTRTY